MFVAKLNFSTCLTALSLLLPACVDIPIGDVEADAVDTDSGADEPENPTSAGGEGPGNSSVGPAGSDGDDEPGLTSGGADTDTDGGSTEGVEAEVIEMTFAGGYWPSLLKACEGEQPTWLVYQALITADALVDFCTENLPSAYFRAEFLAGKNPQLTDDAVAYDLAGQDAEYCVDEVCVAVVSGSLALQGGPAGLFSLSGSALLEDGTLLAFEDPEQRPNYAGNYCISNPVPVCS